MRESSARPVSVVDAPETRGEAAWYGRLSGVMHPKLEWDTVLKERV